MPRTVHGFRMSTEATPELLATLRESASRTFITGEPDHEALAELRASGLLGTVVPVEYGGAGGDALAANQVIMQLAQVNPSVSIIAFQHFAVCARIAEWGSKEQREALLPLLADGACLAASAWSETGAGAAKHNLSCTGSRRPDGSWVLNGTKSFATSASIADIYLILVQTGQASPGGATPRTPLGAPDGEASTSDTRRSDPRIVYGAEGQTFFLVTAGNPGLAASLSLNIAGMRGSATGRVSLSDCVVPDRDRLGAEGGAHEVIAGVRESGVTLGAVAIGAAAAALDLLVAHMRQRGLMSSPAMCYRLVDLATRIESARALVEQAGRRSSANPGLTTLHSKLHASTMAEEVCLEVARMLGSTGYTATCSLNQILADARAVALMGPANDLCRDLVTASWQN